MSTPSEFLDASAFLAEPANEDKPVVAEPATTPTPAPAAAAQVPVVQRDPSKHVDLEALRQDLPLERAGSSFTLRKRLAQGKSIRVTRKDRKSGGGLSGNESWLRLIGSVTLMDSFNPEAPSEAYLEGLFRPSWMAECAEAEAAGEEPTSWDTIKDMFERSRATALVKRAEFAAKRQAEDKMLDAIRARLGRPAPIKPVDPDKPEESWRLLLETKTMDDGSKRLLPIVANLNTILTHDPELKGLKFNALTQKIEIHGGPLYAGEVEPVLDHHIIRLGSWIKQRYGLQFQKTDLWDYVGTVARVFGYDPLIDRFEWLGKQWDGIVRLPSVARDILRVQGDDEAMQHASDVTQLWFISLAARALDPGCQCDSMLVLRSEAQGVGKSSFAQKVGGKYFADQPIDVHDKDTFMVTCISSVAEFGELAGMNRRDRNSLLAFITRRVDRFRPPYGRVSADYPRRCVLIGTTNEDDFLSDTTGNRRFWVVTVGPGPINLKLLDEQLDQLIGEAVVAFRNGAHWWLTDEQAERSERVAKSFSPTSYYVQRIEREILIMEPKARPATLDLLSTAALIELTPDKAGDKTDQLIRALKMLGFAKNNADGSFTLPERLRIADKLTDAQIRASRQWGGVHNNNNNSGGHQ